MVSSVVSTSSGKSVASSRIACPVSRRALRGVFILARFVLRRPPDHLGSVSSKQTDLDTPGAITTCSANAMADLDVEYVTKLTHRRLVAASHSISLSFNLAALSWLREL